MASNLSNDKSIAGDAVESVEEKLKGVVLEENVKKDSTDAAASKCAEANQIDGKAQGQVISSYLPFSLPSGFAPASAADQDDTYSMNHPKRGHCVIFNHKYFNVNNLGERNGTNVDRDNVKNLFQGLGFDVHVHDDTSVKQIKHILEEYAYEVDHSNCDCFVVVFMSHGEEGHLYGKDGIFKSEQLFSCFTADQCVSLAGKPKMFFIQACRGEGLDAGVTMVKPMDETDSGSFSMYKIPVHADFLVSWSTVPGHYSWRNTSNGSWFIQSIVKVFSRYAHTMDVLSMMTVVNRYMILSFESNCPSAPGMHGKKQTASITSTLMRFVHIKPKQ